MCKYSDELVGKAVKWHFYEDGWVDISQGYGVGVGDNELDELVEMYIKEFPDAEQVIKETAEGVNEILKDEL